MTNLPVLIHNILVTETLSVFLAGTFVTPLALVIAFWGRWPGLRPFTLCASWGALAIVVVLLLEKLA